MIVSDTNINSSSVQRFRQLAKVYGAEFEVKVFDTPLEVCLERNNLRPEHERVDEKVIRRMHRRLKRGTQMKWVDRPLNAELDKHPAFIFDLDGTLQLMNGRNPFDSLAAATDMPNASVLIIALGLQAAYPEAEFIFLSGRHDVAYDITYDALESYGLRVDQLLMRASGDNRKDSIIKSEIYTEEIELFFNVVAIFDDRDQVVEMWRDLGLHVMQVAPGNF